MKKAKIAFLMHGARNIGGGEQSIFFLIKNLRKDLFEPLVLFSQENEIIGKFREEGISVLSLPLNEKITSVYRDRIKKNPLNLLIYASYIISGIFRLTILIKKAQVQLLHPHDNLSKIIACFAGKMTGVKVVAHCRDLLGQSLIEKMLILCQLLFMNKIIAVSESNRRLFKVGRRIPKKVLTIYNGIDMKEFNPAPTVSLRDELKINNGKFVLGMIGVFDPCKGHIYLFQAIKHLISEGIRNIICLVVGDGREKDHLKKYVDRKELNNYIRFFGYRRDIPQILSSVDVVVMPSLQESFPRVPLEAMVMKRPVIATSVGGLPEVVSPDETGIIVPPKDPESLAQAIKYLIDHPEERIRMGEAGRIRVEQLFSLEKNIRKTEELYLDILGYSQESGQSRPNFLHS